MTRDRPAPAAAASARPADEVPAPAWRDAAGAGSRELRDLFGTFLTGVTVVTAWDAAGAPVGFTANSFTSVSLDPPLVLVCVANAGRSCETLCTAPRFAVNILADTQRDISAAFASRAGRRFEAAATWARPGGPPLIEGTLSAIDCARERIVAAGDHAIVIGRVLGFARGGGQPLGYFRGGYTAVTADLAALERGHDAILVAGLLEWQGRVLLIRRPGAAHWAFPSVALRHGEDHRQALPRLLERLGIAAEISALYSVFQNEADPHTVMLFRGACRTPPGDAQAGLALFAEADQPWLKVAGRSHAQALKRFFREQKSARFGIYWDTEDGGRLATLAGPPDPWRPREGGDRSKTRPL